MSNWKHCEDQQKEIISVKFISRALASETVPTLCYKSVTPCCSAWSQSFERPNPFSRKLFKWTHTHQKKGIARRQTSPEMIQNHLSNVNHLQSHFHSVRDDLVNAAKTLKMLSTTRGKILNCELIQFCLMSTKCLLRLIWIVLHARQHAARWFNDREKMGFHHTRFEQFGDIAKRNKEQTHVDSTGFLWNN